ncbi:MAG: flavodoxin domain-containing protein [Deinococcota bacterium]
MINTIKKDTEIPRVLVTYASKHGATLGIATKIADVLQSAGVMVDLKPAHDVYDVNFYHTVVLGTGIYIGRWLQDAVKFANMHKDLLAERHVWVFLSGPTGEDALVDVDNVWKPSKHLLRLIRHIAPRTIQVFKGAVRPEDLSRIERWLVSNVGAATGDYRDWPAIEAWAQEIVDDIHSEIGNSEIGNSETGSADTPEVNTDDQNVAASSHQGVTSV